MRQANVQDLCATVGFGSAAGPACFDWLLCFPAGARFLLQKANESARETRARKKSSLLGRPWKAVSSPAVMQRRMRRPMPPCRGARVGRPRLDSWCLGGSRARSSLQTPFSLRHPTGLLLLLRRLCSKALPLSCFPHLVGSGSVAIGGSARSRSRSMLLRLLTYSVAPKLAQGKLGTITSAN